MGLFAKATDKAKLNGEKVAKRKGTPWIVGDQASIQVAGSVHELVGLEAQKKALDAKMEIHKTVVKKYAEGQYIQNYADREVPPDSPMYVQNADGEKVTYVVQDRSGQYQVKDTQQDALRDLLGADAAENLLYQESTISFNRDVLAHPGVQEAVEKALESALKKLDIPDELKDSLVDVEVKTAFKPGTFERITQICGKDTAKIKQFLDIAASSCCRYVKA